MKKILSLIIIAGFLVGVYSTGEAQEWKRPKAPEKRNYYDLFGESLQARLWSLGLVDINGLTGGSSVLRQEAWGFITDQGYNVTYSDKYKKISATFKLGYYYWGIVGLPYFCTELFDVNITPYTFQKIWVPGMIGTLKTPQHNGTLFFARTSNMTPGASESASSTYLLLLRDEFPVKIDEINLKVGGTYMHHWKDTHRIDEMDYRGNIANAPPNTVTLRFSDDSPEDGGGAALYDFWYSIDGGDYVHVPPPAPPMEANGAFSFEWPTGGISVPSGAKSVKVKFLIAGDYKVEIKSDQVAYATILRAPGNPKDINEKKEITYSYGLPSASDVFGITAKGTVYGVNVEMECNFNNQYRKYPVTGGERDFDMFPVAYVKAERKIDFTGLKFIDDKLVVGGDYFYTHPSYLSPNWGASTFESYKYVDDNDDYDWYVDKEGKGIGEISCNPVPQYHMAYDRDSYGDADWEQDFFLFNTDPPRFWVGIDRNNNMIADVYEDDNYPDYPYKLDRHGYGIYATYPLLKDIGIMGGYDDFGEAFGTRKTVNIYLQTQYKTKISDFGDITLWHTIKRAWDDIPDDLVELKSKDSPNETFMGSDPLAFQDSLYNAFYVESKYTGFKGLTVSNKFKFENNYQYADARNVRWAGFITNAVYAYQPTKLFTLAPQWKCWTEKGLSFPEYSLYASDRQVNAFLLKAIYKLFDKTTVTAGIQYKLVRLPLDTANEYNKLSFAAQLVSKAGSYPLVLGYLRNLSYFINDPSRNSKDETIFLKIYSVR